MFTISLSVISAIVCCIIGTKNKDIGYYIIAILIIVALLNTLLASSLIFGMILAAIALIMCIIGGFKNKDFGYFLVFILITGREFYIYMI